ncbi:hypothetical protein B0I37DRAFT_372886 [Chaetomium sp. MPI-CAGE-AT-0009]|nr:hypothetical protein B0I37DRAFT_372886 [Chaetomium sp. MPI-CAGE-AT-0009]
MAESEAQNFVQYVNRSLDEEESFHFLRFEFLQRLNLTHFHVKLARIKSRIQKQGQCSEDELDTLQGLLKDYATAIRDYRYLRSCRPVPKAEMRLRKALLQRYFQSDDDFQDPFHSHYCFFEDEKSQVDPLRATLMQHLPVALTYSSEERRQRPREYEEGKVPLLVSAFVDRSVRFITAMTGGVFLVAPMLIMSLGPSQTKSLLTVSVAVVVFSLVLSFGIRVSNVETLVATATYAAVLVVFVGTSSAGVGS